MHETVRSTNERESTDLQICHAIINPSAPALAEAHVLDDGRIDIELGTTPQKVRRWTRLFSPPKHYTVHRPIDEDNGPETSPPPLNVVVQVVGSRGDIQPFIALGQELKKSGHRVRIATHHLFKEFVESNDLEFFNIGGDPKKLMSYMVRNPGLLPSFRSIAQGDISDNQSDMQEILDGCWRACFQMNDEILNSPTSDSKYAKPFLANAIIANPPSFAHVHCAEKIGIPLHLMFTMPWSPTQAFPHPLANIQSSSFKASMTNYLSYVLVETLTWEGLGGVINSFRRKTLGLPPLDRSTGPTLLSQLRIPYTYCWSASLIPKPEDWGTHISVSGFYFLPTAPYVPSSELDAFLSDGPTPVYVGFGSIVVDNPMDLTQLVLDAVRMAGVRAIVSHGWSDLGSDHGQAPHNVYYIGNCPHSWIFKRVSCVVHHGGAGTTAAAMQSGKPSIIVPFFGDQSFWGHMVAKAGAGPDPIPYKQLTAAKLAAAIHDALHSSILRRAELLSDEIQREEGVQQGVSVFHRQLSQSRLSCSISPDHAATWKVCKTDIRLSSCGAAMLMDKGLLDYSKVELLRPCSYDLNIGPTDPLSGVAFAITDSVADLVGGLGVFSSSVKYLVKGQIKSQENQNTSVKRYTVINGLRGIGRSSATLIQMPVHISVALTQGLHNAPKLWGDNKIRPQPAVDCLQGGLKAGCTELFYGTFDGFSALLWDPVASHQRERTRNVIVNTGLGALSCVSKTLSGLTALVSYPLKGLEAELEQRISTKRSSAYENSLLQQGLHDAAGLDDNQESFILNQWERLTADVKERKLKRKSLRTSRFRKS